MAKARLAVPTSAPSKARSSSATPSGNDYNYPSGNDYRKARSSCATQNSPRVERDVLSPERVAGLMVMAKPLSRTCTLRSRVLVSQTATRPVTTRKGQWHCPSSPPRLRCSCVRGGASTPAAATVARAQGSAALGSLSPSLPLSLSLSLSLSPPLSPSPSLSLSLPVCLSDAALGSRQCGSGAERTRMRSTRSAAGRPSRCAAQSARHARE